MTCKDCIHYDVCYKKHYHYANSKYRQDIDFVEKVCHFFKDESKYTELPCNIGDKVYHTIIENSVVDKSEAKKKLKELKNENNSL